MARSSKKKKDRTSGELRKEEKKAEQIAILEAFNYSKLRSEDSALHVCLCCTGYKIEDIEEEELQLIVKQCLKFVKEIFGKT
jgi:hypothetical protein